MKREHKWDKDDTIIALYYTKFGIKHLPVKDEKDLAENIIGSSLDSLKMLSTTLGKTHDVSFSKIQREVVDEFKKMQETDFRDVVLEIFSDTERKVVVEERIKDRKENEKEEKAKEEKKKLDSIFRKMGKDPSKMRSVGVRPKEF